VHVFEELIMAKNIYVGNLSYSVGNDDLESIFTQFGNVSRAQVIQHRDTGRSKGFGFVEMDDEDAAEKAIEELDGSDFEGRNLTVNEARPREDRPSRDGGGGYGGGSGGGSGYGGGGSGGGGGGGGRSGGGGGGGRSGGGGGGGRSGGGGNSGSSDGGNGGGGGGGGRGGW
jgi:RNA recognition motif-containing protein